LNPPNDMTGSSVFRIMGLAMRERMAATRYSESPWLARR
jgi:hypothetical protein